MNKQEALSRIDQKRELFCRVSDEIWEYAETAFEETHSAQALCQALEAEGFEVTAGLAGIPTAFCGRYGSGRPVIGILGEFDALSGLNQAAGQLSRQSPNPGAPGHGCGHNLLGAGSLAAAVAVKAYLESRPGRGTVIYYGCPGEEGGSGKAFMARDGVFDQLDCALTWHPDTANNMMSYETLANCQIIYRFEGVSAHAGACPHLGRSALDAVELMNVGVQFLREHMIPDARVHYAITDTGGYSPNVVQAQAEALYLIRAPRNDQVTELRQRVDDIARGAALMTGTRLTTTFMKACSNILINRSLEEVMERNLREVPLYPYTREERELAARYNATAAVGAELADGRKRRMTREQILEFEGRKNEPIYTAKEVYLPGERKNGSTDVGDVSWICPTAQVNTAAWASKTPGHSWQVVSQGRSSQAHKGLLYAGKVIAATAIDLLENPAPLQAAWEEHRENLAGRPYCCPIPQGVLPRQLSQK